MYNVYMRTKGIGGNERERKRERGNSKYIYRKARKKEEEGCGRRRSGQQRQCGKKEKRGSRIIDTCRSEKKVEVRDGRNGSESHVWDNERGRETIRNAFHG